MKTLSKLLCLTMLICIHLAGFAKDNKNSIPKDTIPKGIYRISTEVAIVPSATFEYFLYDNRVLSLRMSYWSTDLSDMIKYHTGIDFNNGPELRLAYNKYYPIANHFYVFGGPQLFYKHMQRTRKYHDYPQLTETTSKTKKNIYGALLQGGLSFSPYLYFFELYGGFGGSYSTKKVTNPEYSPEIDIPVTLKFTIGFRLGMWF